MYTLLYADVIVINKIKYEVDLNKKIASVIKNNGILRKSLKGTVTIPSKIIYNGIEYPVISIQNAAFENLNLKSIIISEGVIRIENAAFLNCKKLESVIIPATITYIGHMGFQGCISLVQIEIRSNYPPDCGLNIFLHVPVEKCRLLVPNCSISIYTDSSTWKNFIIK